MPGCFIHDAVKLNVPRQGQNGPVGVISLFPILPAQFERQLLQMLDFPHWISSQRGGQKPFAQFHEQLLSRIVFQSLERLQGQIAGRVESSLRQMAACARCPHKLANDSTTRSATAGATESRVMHADAAGPLQTKTVQIIGQLPAIPVPAAAQDQIGQHCRRSGPIDRIACRPRRQQQASSPPTARPASFRPEGSSRCQTYAEKSVATNRLRAKWGIIGGNRWKRKEDGKAR